MIKIAKNDLKETLGIAQATLGNGPDITSHFLFEKVGEEVFVSACNPPRIYSSIPLKGCKIEAVDTDESEDPQDSFSAFTLEGKRVIQAINAVEGLLTITLNEGSVKITSDKGVLELSSLDPSAFPPWREMLSEANETATTPSNLLADVLTLSKPFASTDETRRPELAQVYITKGMAFSCDGFGLSMAKSESFNDLDVKFHLKDVAPATKFLKAHEGHGMAVLSSDKAVFLKAEDGALFGMMDVPFDMPKPITEKYIDAFDWTPRRVWRIKKDDFANALNFLSSGADDDNLKVELIDSEAESLSPPRLEMASSNGKVISYNLDPVELSFDLTDDLDLNTIEDLGERLYADRALQDKKGETEGDDIDSFSFNISYMRRSLDVTSNVITFGCNREGEKRGYMLFKQATASGAVVVSILGWMV
jgi:hypothetical protein